MNPLLSTREELRDLIGPLSALTIEIVRLYDQLVGSVDNADHYGGVHDLFVLAQLIYHNAHELEDIVRKVKVLAECAKDRIR